MSRSVQVLDEVVVRFAGDSGDGMQLTGSQFTSTTAVQGNDLATFPDFPAEIRAPAGTRAGVSGFQIHFSSRDIHTPGDAPSVLVAMNPAALVANISDLKAGGMVIVNTDKFTDRDLDKADLASNPLEDGSLEGFQLVPVQLTAHPGRSRRARPRRQESDRCRTSSRSAWPTGSSIRTCSTPRRGFRRVQCPVRRSQQPCSAGRVQLRRHGGNLPQFLRVPAAPLPPGLYRNITENEALALGFVAASKLSGLRLFQGAYPITPASDVLHYLSRYKDFGVVTFQAEDEIAAIAATIGAAFGGALAITSSSGPGIALKEALGLGLMTELPMVSSISSAGAVDRPPRRPPTSTSRCSVATVSHPLAVVAAQTPADCFDTALEACRVALKYKMPVMVLTDGYLANGAEPWRLRCRAPAPIDVKHATTEDVGPGPFLPYKRDGDPRAPVGRAGTPGLERRIGGLEKQQDTGNVSYDPQNHEDMTRVRQAKVDAVRADIPDLDVYGDDGGLLVVSWGGTFGAVRTASTRLDCPASR